MGGQQEVVYRLADLKVLRYGYADMEFDPATEAKVANAFEFDPPTCPYPGGVQWYYDSVGDTFTIESDLSQAKRGKITAIDSRTEALIGMGFNYNGTILSLSNNAQNYWNGLGNMAANGLLEPPYGGGSNPFPLEVNSRDDLTTYAIADKAEAVAVFATASATVKAHLASGTALKNSVRAATTVAEVDAVVDTR